MRVDHVSPEHVKNVARSLKRALVQAGGPEISLPKAHELAAYMLGYSTFHELQQAYAAHPFRAPVIQDDDLPPDQRAIRRAFQATRLLERHSVGRDAAEKLVAAVALSGRRTSDKSRHEAAVHAAPEPDVDLAGARASLAEVAEMFGGSCTIRRLDYHQPSRSDPLYRSTTSSLTFGDVDGADGSALRDGLTYMDEEDRRGDLASRRYFSLNQAALVVQRVFKPLEVHYQADVLAEIGPCALPEDLPNLRSGSDEHGPRAVAAWHQILENLRSSHLLVTTDELRVSIARTGNTPKASFQLVRPWSSQQTIVLSSDDEPGPSAAESERPPGATIALPSPAASAMNDAAKPWLQHLALVFPRINKVTVTLFGRDWDWTLLPYGHSELTGPLPASRDPRGLISLAIATEAHSSLAHFLWSGANRPLLALSWNAVSAQLEGQQENLTRFGRAAGTDLSCATAALLVQIGAPELAQRVVPRFFEKWLAMTKKGRFVADRLLRDNEGMKEPGASLQSGETRQLEQMSPRLAELFATNTPDVRKVRRASADLSIEEQLVASVLLAKRRYTEQAASLTPRFWEVFAASRPAIRQFVLDLLIDETAT